MDALCERGSIMNDLTIWNYENTEVRTIEKDGETWWVLADVCKVLELTTPAKVAERLDEDEKGMNLIHTLGGNQEMTIISESGLYSVILRSDKPQAKPFRRWVTHEVLPEIRRTGSYNAPVPVLTVDDYIGNTCKAFGLHEPISATRVICLADVPDDYYVLQAWNALRATYGYAPNSKDITIDKVLIEKNILEISFHVGIFREGCFFVARFRKRKQEWRLSKFTYHTLMTTEVFYH